MKLKFLLLTFALFYPQNLQAKTMKELTNRYIDYINRMGATKSADEITEKNFPAIWTPACKKTLNGKVLYDDGGFLKQLRDVRQNHGNWQPFKVKDTFYHEDDRVAFIRYGILVGGQEIQAAKILTFDEKGMITTINEAFSGANATANDF